MKLDPKGGQIDFVYRAFEHKPPILHTSRGFVDIKTSHKHVLRSNSKVHRRYDAAKSVFFSASASAAPDAVCGCVGGRVRDIHVSR